LGKLEATAAARNEAEGPAILFVYPDEWPAEDREAFDAAKERGDRIVRHGLIERHLGVRPGPRTLVIAYRLRSDGPQ
jgi:hypothetical protein